MRGVISEEMYLAGKRYAGDVHRYSLFIDPPPRLRTTYRADTRDDPMTQEERMKLPPADPIRLPKEPTAEDHAQWAAKYKDAFEALSVAGHKACRAVARVAVHGEGLPHGTRLHHLIDGLKLLVIHYGLKTKARA